MQYKKSSWKDKLDPAFDKIIKNYILFLEQVKLPANSGWIMLTEEFYKIWEQKEMKGWTDHYEEWRGMALLS